MPELFTDRRFWPLFWTQFLGALNDNVFKNALVVMVTYQNATVAGLSPASVVALSTGIFILPYFLFSPLAGQMADKHEKSRLMQLTKYWEVLIMALAGIGFLFHAFALLLVVLFLAGVQATLFGPLKYSMIPELVTSEELVSANAYVESGTFLAILLGTIAGGTLASMHANTGWVAGVLVALAVLGTLASLKVKKLEAIEPDLRVRWNPLPGMLELHRILWRNKPVYNAITAISWFWFFGAALLSILPIFCKVQLHGDGHVVTAFLAMFTLGIGAGSLICGRLSKHKIELGFVPLGALGMSGFLFDLAYVRPRLTGQSLMGLAEFLHHPWGFHLMGDFFFVSLFGGVFILPLYAFMQEGSRIEERSRVIASNNIMNAIFMVGASLTVLLFNAWDFSFSKMFFVLAVANLAICAIIFWFESAYFQRWRAGR